MFGNWVVLVVIGGTVALCILWFEQLLPSTSFYQPSRTFAVDLLPGNIEAGNVPVQPVATQNAESKELLSGEKEIGNSTFPLLILLQGSARKHERGSDVSSYQLALAGILVSLFPNTFFCRSTGAPLPRMPQTLHVIFACDQRSFRDPVERSIKEKALQDLARSLSPLNIEATFVSTGFTKSVFNTNHECVAASWCKYTFVVEHDWFLVPSRIPFSIDMLTRILGGNLGVGGIRFRKNTSVPGRRLLRHYTVKGPTRDDIGPLIDHVPQRQAKGYFFEGIDSNKTALRENSKSEAVHKSESVAMKSILKADTIFCNNPRIGTAINELLTFEFCGLQPKTGMTAFEWTCASRCKEERHGDVLDTQGFPVPNFGEKWETLKEADQIISNFGSEMTRKRLGIKYYSNVRCGIHSAAGDFDFQAFHMNGKSFNFAENEKQFLETSESFRNLWPVDKNTTRFERYYSIWEELFDLAHSLQFGFLLPQLVPSAMKKNDTTVQLAGCSRWIKDWK